LKNLSCILLALCFVLFYSCKTEEKYFAYRINLTYLVDTIETDYRAASDIISYKPYLFEYKLKTIVNNSIYGSPQKIIQTWYYDTIGIYLINPKQRTFVEFDGFKKNATIQHSGKFSEKKTGFRLIDSVPFVKPLSADLKIRDTMAWGRKLYYLQQTAKNMQGEDSVIVNLFYIKNPYIESLFDIDAIPFPDTNHSIIGLTMHLVEQKQTATMKLEKLRPLTKEEKKICEELVRKSGFKGK
jgi:hypothetical protein